MTDRSIDLARRANPTKGCLKHFNGFFRITEHVATPVLVCQNCSETSGKPIAEDLPFSTMTMQALTHQLKQGRF